MNRSVQFASENRVTAARGIILSYEDIGHGHPIVFLHGIAASSYSWFEVTRALSDSYRCVSLDLMGFGDSSKPRNESYSLKRQAELVLQAIRQLGLAKPILVGHSMGGGVCLSMLRELGEKQREIAGLVLIDTACYPQKLPAAVKFLRLPVLPALALKIMPERWLFQFSGGSFYRDRMKQEAIEEYTRCLKSPGAHEALIASAREIIPANVDELISLYPTIDVPTLIVWGRYDSIIPLELGRRLAGEVPGSRLCEVECGHCPQEECPEETEELLRKFALEIAKRAPGGAP